MTFLLLFESRVWNYQAVFRIRLDSRKLYSLRILSNPVVFLSHLYSFLQPHISCVGSYIRLASFLLETHSHSRSRWSWSFPVTEIFLLLSSSIIRKPHIIRSIHSCYNCVEKGWNISNLWSTTLFVISNCRISWDLVRHWRIVPSLTYNQMDTSVSSSRKTIRELRVPWCHHTLSHTYGKHQKPGCYTMAVSKSQCYRQENGILFVFTFRVQYVDLNYLTELTEWAMTKLKEWLFVLRC
jgi:hypothetical protein